MKKSHSEKSNRHYSKKWEKDLAGSCMMETLMVAIVEFANEHSCSGGVWVTMPFHNWKKATENMKYHEKTSFHVRASQSLLITSREDSVVQRKIEVLEREKNRAPRKSFVHCTHFLARNHNGHSTELVDLVVLWGQRVTSILRKCLKKCSVYILRSSG